MDYKIQQEENKAEEIVHLQCPGCGMRFDLSKLETGEKIRCVCMFELTVPDAGQAVILSFLAKSRPRLGLTIFNRNVSEVEQDRKHKSHALANVSDVSIKKEKPLNIEGTFFGLKTNNILSLRQYDLVCRAHEFLLFRGIDHLSCLTDLKDVDCYSYQQKSALHVLASLGARALLADESGLGKTIEAGLIMKELHKRAQIKKILVLVPAPLVVQWHDELATKFRLSFQIADKRKDWQDYPRIVASIERAKQTEHFSEVCEIKWDLVIFNGAHILKDKNSLSWKLVNGINKRYILLLTATPFQENFLELFNLIALIRPGQHYLEQGFKQKLLTYGNTRAEKDPDKTLKKLLRTVMVRNRHEDVDVKLTKCQHEIKQLTMLVHERNLYVSACNFCRAHFQKLFGNTADQVAVDYLNRLDSSFLSFREFLNNHIVPRVTDSESRAVTKEVEDLVFLANECQDNVKLDALMQVINSHKEKILVFVQYCETAAYISSRLKSEGVSFSVYDRLMSRKEKDHAVEEFKKDHRILICTEPAGEGRNLHFVHNLVNYDLPWDPVYVVQRTGCLHQIGQSKDVVISTLVCKNTIESYLLDLFEMDLKLFGLSVGDVLGILGKTNVTGRMSELFRDSKSNYGFEERFMAFKDEAGAMRARYDYCKSENDRIFSELGF